MLLKTTRIAVLTVAALNDLAQQPEGCCPVCCAKCWVLQDMYRKGDLDKVVNQAPGRLLEGSSWWEPTHQSVVTSWLTSQWLKYECDHGLYQDEDADEAQPVPDTIAG